jgi:exodeoxyribonuclease VII large subunit
MQPALFPTTAFPVKDITHYIRQLLESDDILHDLWVLGEVSNLKYHSSGHIYFTLKDESAALNCAIWRNSAARIKLTLREGMAIEAHGSIGVYEKSGQYQLYVDAVRLAGEGRLYQEYLRLKARLEAEGLFDQERKRPIPARPRRIGIVTSPTGAALQDMLNTLQRRYPLVEVLLAPASVQGDAAPLEIVAALAAVNQAHPDVILLGRGGGSLEDLWAFNDERVVRAVVASQAPVISGVGHETDFTLVDFAADLRAPTPTAAAVLATPDVADLHLGLSNLSGRLELAFQSGLETRQVYFIEFQQRLRRASPLWRIQNDRQRLDELADRSLRALGHSLQLRRAHSLGLHNRLAALSPLAVLERGFAVVSRANGSLVRSYTQVQPGDEVQVRLVDGQFDAEVK